MGRTGGRRRRSLENRAAVLGIIVVVIFLAVAVSIRSSSLRSRNREYQAIEESLDAEIQSEERKSLELQERKIYVKTKEYIIEKAREIFKLKLPDEIIVQPEN